MSEQREAHGRTTVTLREQGWAPKSRQHYPPPQAVNRYSMRALPPPPTQLSPHTPSPSSSIYDSEEQEPPSQRRSAHVLAVYRADGSRESATFEGAIDEGALAMVRPPQILFPNTRVALDDHEQVISPQPQRPGSKAVSLWEERDEFVSPIETPGTANWKQHVVSPLSDASGEETDSESDQVSILESDGSLEDRVSEQRDQWRFSSSRRLKNDRTKVILETPQIQVLKKSRFSDPGSPAGFGLGAYESSDAEFWSVNPFARVSRSHTVRKQPQAQSMYFNDSRIRSQDTPAIGESSRPSFPPSEPNEFLTRRANVKPRRPSRPPSFVSEQPVKEHGVKLPFAPPVDYGSSQEQTCQSGEPSTNQQNRTSGLASSFRSSTQMTERPSPGFDDILGRFGSDHNQPQTQNQGRLAAVPKVRDILSKAKQGFGLGLSSDELKREKRREELKRQIRHSRVG
ncbi:hypothetical protein F5Y17DRAFT_460619 [Xylariaceae sp. FL0594]|nr:hypothetical protein F5Y17DRAFT_460619 [Xylariaceae sp. FL0594]